MPLQLRRGTTAERLSIVPLPGEPILDTDLNTIFIGNGSTAGGISALTGINSENAMDIVGQMFINGQHEGLTFLYGPTQDGANRIDAKLELSSYDGEFAASAFRGSLYANDSTLLVNADTGQINPQAISGTFGGPIAASQITTAILTADNMFGVLTGDMVGSVFADSSALLVNGVDGSINLDGTIKGDVIPAGNELYDLGSNSNRFKDLYLSGSSIFLGNAVITSTGSAVNLPAGSTVDGISIGTGTGTGDGVVEGSNYKINLVADDSSMFVNSATKQIFSTDVESSAITTALIRSSDSSDIVFDSPVRMSSRVKFDSDTLFEDEAVFLVNNNVSRIATLSQHHNDVFGAGLAFRRSRGTFTSPLVLQAEDVMGQCDFIGYDANGNYTRCASVKGVVDSTIFGGIVPGRLEFVTNDTLGNSVRRLYIDGNGFVYLESILRQTFTQFASGFQATGYYQSYDTTNQVRPHAYFKSRGTFIAPTVINSGDEIAKITFNSHNGTGYVEGASILVTNVGGIVGTSAPSRIIFRTDDGSGLAGRVVIRHTGILAANFGLAVRGDITPVDVDADLSLDPAAQGVGTIDFGVPEQTTVGAAGVANALPANPSTYLKIKVNGVEYVIPAFAVS